MKKMTVFIVISTVYILLAASAVAIQPQITRDVDGDGYLEFAIDADEDSTNGYEVFYDEHADTEGNISEIPVPLSHNVKEGFESYVDGDDDGKMDFFIATCGCSAMNIDRYWDPDEDILTVIHEEYYVDVNDDGTLDVTYDSDGDGEVDRWLFITEKTTYPLNQPPVADAGGGYHSTVDEAITFDASDSYDPNEDPLTYGWDFGDGSSGSGMTVDHSYSSTGTYTVILTVTDTSDESDSDQAQVVIEASAGEDNAPPSDPVIEGEVTGVAKTSYSFTFSSMDEDDDLIRYTIDWGDDKTSTSGNMPSGLGFTKDHSWSSSGIYIVSVVASDGIDSGSSTQIIAIDAHLVSGYGYLEDTDSDGIYDEYHSEDGERISDLDLGTSGYLIDMDGDGTMDHSYDIEAQVLQTYQSGSETTSTSDETNGSTPGFELMCALVACALVCIVVRYRS